MLHQPEILLRVTWEMLVNPNAIKERIDFTKELVWSVDKALNDPESKDIIKAKIKEIKEQNWDNSPVTEFELKKHTRSNQTTSCLNNGLNNNELHYLLI